MAPLFFFFNYKSKLLPLLSPKLTKLLDWSPRKTIQSWRDSPVVRDICCSCKDPRVPARTCSLTAVCNSRSKQTPSTGLSGKKQMQMPSGETQPTHLHGMFSSSVYTDRYTAFLSELKPEFPGEEHQLHFNLCSIDWIKIAGCGSTGLYTQEEQTNLQESEAILVYTESWASKARE